MRGQGETTRRQLQAYPPCYSKQQGSPLRDSRASAAAAVVIQKCSSGPSVWSPTDPRVRWDWRVRASSTARASSGLSAE